MPRRPDPNDWHRCDPYEIEYSLADRGQIECTVCGWGWKLKKKGWKRLDLSLPDAV
jgi:hypothetical protein